MMRPSGEATTLVVEADEGSEVALGRAALVGAMGETPMVESVKVLETSGECAVDRS
jgi:hypothetical protein